jgi:hypothetical protein
MFIYTGKNTDTGEQLICEFDTDHEARNFIDDNLSQYPEYKVYEDEEEYVVYSNQIDDDAQASARENMYPVGDDSDY